MRISLTQKAPGRERRRFLTQYNSVYLILAMLCLAALVYEPTFFRYENFNMILRQAATLGILTMGHVFVISCGCVDLSVVAIMQMSIAVFMLFVKYLGASWLPLGIACSLLAGILIGAGNGVIVSHFKVQPFLSTLFIGTILTGVRKIVSGVTPLGVPPAILIQLVKGEWIVSYSILWFALAALIAYLLIDKTVYGRSVMMVGTNATAALFSGVKVKRTITAAYVISAIAAVLAGIMATGYLGFADQTTIGNGMEMDSLVAAVLGGNFLSGGRASISGAVGGALAMTLMLNIVILFGLEVQYQYVLKGIVLLAVIFISGRTRR